MPNILITTLGQTWQIVPELLGLTNPEKVDFYLSHDPAQRYPRMGAGGGRNS